MSRAFERYIGPAIGVGFVLIVAAIMAAACIAMGEDPAGFIDR